MSSFDGFDQPFTIPWKQTVLNFILTHPWIFYFFQEMFPFMNGCGAKSLLQNHKSPFHWPSSAQQYPRFSIYYPDIYIYAILSFLLVIAFPTGWVGVAIHLDVQPFRDWIASPVTGGWLSHGKTHTTQKSSNDQAHRHKSSPIIISSYKFYQFLSPKKQSWIDIYIYIYP